MEKPLTGSAVIVLISHLDARPQAALSARRIDFDEPYRMGCPAVAQLGSMFLLEKAVLGLLTKQHLINVFPITPTPIAIERKWFVPRLVAKGY